MMPRPNSPTLAEVDDLLGYIDDMMGKPLELPLTDQVQYLVHKSFWKGHSHGHRGKLLHPDHLPKEALTWEALKKSSRP